MSFPQTHQHRSVVKEEVRAAVQPEFRQVETRLHTLEVQTQVQNEIISLLFAFLLKHTDQIEAGAVRSFLNDAQSPYSELDIKHGYFLDAVNWLQERLPAD